MNSSGWTTYGTISSFGWRVQADAPAIAIEAPIKRRNLRREPASFQSGVRFRNSSSMAARMFSVEARSSILRQYMGSWRFIRSPVACHAIRRGLNVIFTNQPRSQCRLLLRILVRRIKNFLSRSNMTLGITMTLDTPLHVKRVDL